MELEGDNTMEKRVIIKYQKGERQSISEACRVREI